MAYSRQDNISFHGIDRNVILVFNGNSVPLPGGSAIAVSTVRQLDNSWCICVAPAVSDEEIWGIAAETILPETWGNMIISGVARAQIVSGNGMFAIPTSAGLTAANSGKAQIVYRGTEDIPGVIVIGYSGNTEIYSGQFALRNIGERRFEVCWPQNNIAGCTDLPGVEQIPVKTLTLPENSYGETIMFYACCNENVYSAEIQWKSQTRPQGVFDSVMIGYAGASGAVSQYYLDADGIGFVFGRRWFL